MGRSLLLMLVVALLAFGCSSSDEEQRDDQPTRETTGERSEPPEETTAPRETTEVTTGFEFEVGRTPMDEDDDDAGRRRSRAAPEATPREAPPVREEAQPEPQPADEKDAPPEPAESAIECRFFTQSEWVQADAEQKAFIQECDRAAGRAVPSASPSEKERDAEEPPQEERAVQPEPQSPLPTPPEPQPKASPSGGDVDCPDLAPGEAQSYLLPGDPYGLDKDNDGLACE